MSWKLCHAMRFATVLTLVACVGFFLSADPQKEKSVKSEAGDYHEVFRRALAKPLTVNYDRVPLNQVANDLQSKLGVPVQLDLKALSDVAIAFDTPVQFTSSNVSARATIALLLRRLGLAMVTSHDAVMITTPEEAENDEVTKVYEVTDLVRVGDAASEEDQPDFDQLIDIITSCVRPTTWPTGTGPGPIYPLSACGIDVIALSQMEYVQEEVAALLSQLRAVRHAPSKCGNGAGAQALPAPLSPPICPAEVAIRRALTKPVVLEYDKLPLSVVVKDLEAKLHIPIRLDNRALEDDAIGNDTPVTFASSNISAKAAIELLLRPLKLGSFSRYESLLITTPEEADYDSFQTRVYDVFDLLGSDPKHHQVDINPLRETIVNCIQPKSWSISGGPGTIVPFEAPGINALVVFQSEQVRDEIDTFFTQLRSIRHITSSNQHKTGSPIFPRMSKAEETVRQALLKRISIRLNNVTLSQVVETLREKTGLPIVLGGRLGLDAYAGVMKPAVSDPIADNSKPGIKATTQSAKGLATSSHKRKLSPKGSAQTLITAEAQNVQFDSVLYMILQPLRLTWTYDNECLLITTPEEEENLLSTRCYDVSDLPAYRNELGEGVPDYYEIVSAIMSSVASATWNSIGGPGSIDSFEYNGIQAIVVSQTWRNHRKIESLLAELRRLRGPAPTREDIKKLPPLPKPPVIDPNCKGTPASGGFQPRQKQPDDNPNSTKPAHSGKGMF